MSRMFGLSSSCTASLWLALEGGGGGGGLTKAPGGIIIPGCCMYLSHVCYYYFCYIKVMYLFHKDYNTVPNDSLYEYLMIAREMVEKKSIV